MKIYELEENVVLDIVMKPHRKILDLKCGKDYIFIADHTGKSVVVSNVEEGLLNYDPDVKISKTVSDSNDNPFKQPFFKKNHNSEPNSAYGYGETNQSTAKFGRKMSRQRSAARSK